MVIFQTKCYVVNDKERPSQSTDAEEKNEKATEKVEGEEGSESKNALGTLQFSVGYSAEKSALTVSVICAKNLPVKNDSIGTSDPYVKLQLLPEKRQKVIVATRHCSVSALLTLCSIVCFLRQRQRTSLCLWSRLLFFLLFVFSISCGRL